MRPKRSVPEHGPMDDEMVARFLEDGFVKIEGAFPPRVAELRPAAVEGRGTTRTTPAPGRTPCTG